MSQIALSSEIRSNQKKRIAVQERPSTIFDHHTIKVLSSLFVLIAYIFTQNQHVAIALATTLTALIAGKHYLNHPPTTIEDKIPAVTQPALKPQQLAPKAKPITLAGIAKRLTREPDLNRRLRMAAHYLRHEIGIIQLISAMELGADPLQAGSKTAHTAFSRVIDHLKEENKEKLVDAALEVMLFYVIARHDPSLPSIPDFNSPAPIMTWPESVIPFLMQRQQFRLSPLCEGLDQKPNPEMSAYIRRAFKNGLTFYTHIMGEARKEKDHLGPRSPSLKISRTNQDDFLGDPRDDTYAAESVSDALYASIGRSKSEVTDPSTFEKSASATVPWRYPQINLDLATHLRRLEQTATPLQIVIGGPGAQKGSTRFISPQFDEIMGSIFDASQGRQIVRVVDKDTGVLSGCKSSVGKELSIESMSHIEMNKDHRRAVIQANIAGKDVSKWQATELETIAAELDHYFIGSPKQSHDVVITTQSLRYPACTNIAEGHYGRNLMLLKAVIDSLKMDGIWYVDTDTLLTLLGLEVLKHQHIAKIIEQVFNATFPNESYTITVIPLKNPYPVIHQPKIDTDTLLAIKDKRTGKRLFPTTTAYKISKTKTAAVR
ncbi:MAG: hypothetical protein O3A01_03765 [bacterium]|nr:hypothetical protein [bacterium]